MRFVTAILLVSLFVAGCSKEEAPKKESPTGSTKPKEFKPLQTNSKKIVAEFNDKKVTEGELNLYTNITAFIDPSVSGILTEAKEAKQIKELKTVLLQGYATEVQVAEEVKREDEFKKQAAEQLKKIEESMKSSATQQPNSPKDLATAIKGKGFTQPELAEYMKRNLQRSAYFEEQLNGDKYTQVKVQHVLIATADTEGKAKRTDDEAKKRAEEVKTKWDKTGDIKKLAKEYSDDTGSKEKSGEIEGPTDLFVAEFAQVGETLELNKISDPIKTEYGYHVLKVLEREEKPLDKKMTDYEMIAQKRIQDLNKAYIDKELKLKVML